MIFAAICKRAAVVRRPSSAISRVFGVFRGLTAVFNRRYLRSFVAQPAQILSALFNLCNSFNPFNNLAAASPRCVHSPRCRAVAAGLWFLPICFGFRASGANCRTCRKEAQMTQEIWEWGLFLRFLRFFAAIPGFCNYFSDFGFPALPGCNFASWRLCVNGRHLD